MESWSSMLFGRQRKQTFLKKYDALEEARK